MTGAGGQLAAQQLPKVVQAVKQVVKPKPAPAPAAAPAGASMGTAMEPAAAPAAQPVVQAADQAVPPPAGTVPPAAPEVPPVAPAAAPAAQTTTEAFEEVGDLVRRASGKGIGSQSARDRLAELAAVNPEAKAAADRLGLELPFDVFSDNPQIRAAVGLTRSAAGSEAEAAWRTTVSKAVDKADDVIKQFDATFVEGAVAPGVRGRPIQESRDGPSPACQTGNDRHHPPWFLQAIELGRRGEAAGDELLARQEIDRCRRVIGDVGDLGDRVSGAEAGRHVDQLHRGGDVRRRGSSRRARWSRSRWSTRVTRRARSWGCRRRRATCSARSRGCGRFGLRTGRRAWASRCRRRVAR